MPLESICSTGREICQLLGAESPADRDSRIFVGITTLDEGNEDQVTFLARPQYRARVEGSRAGLILVPQGVELSDPRAVFVKDVWKAVLALLTHFHPPVVPRGVIHPTAIVPASCQVAASAEVGPYCVLGENVVIGEATLVGAHSILGEGVVIGRNAMLHPRVTIAHGCRIGDRAMLHSGVVIGSDGFRYEVIDRRAVKIPQIGIVVIEEDVEIGANTTIDRASFSETRIGARTKIDNLVQIGHNVEIGSDCLIVAQVGIAGSVKLGRGVVLAGQVGVGDNLTIGDGSRLGARSGVHTNIPAGKDLMGAPALDAIQYFKMVGVMKRLPELYERLKPILKEYESQAHKESAGAVSSRSD